MLAYVFGLFVFFGLCGFFRVVSFFQFSVFACASCIFVFASLLCVNDFVKGDVLMNDVFRLTSAAEKRKELESQIAELKQEELKEWEVRELTIGKIFGDALRSGKLPGDDFVKLISPLISRKGDWKKLGLKTPDEPRNSSVPPVENSVSSASPSAPGVSTSESSVSSSASD